MSSSSIIRHIKDVVCPVCGATPLRESRLEGKHCNGQQFEEREFACGSILEWVPNFDRQQTRKVCPHSELERKKAAERALEAEKFAALAQSLGWSSVQLERLERFLQVDAYPYGYLL